MVPQQYCLRWKYHHSNVQNMFAQLLEKERFCDVTLYCSPNFATQVPNKDTVDPDNIRGVSLRAHRVVLAACSELLGALLGAHEAQGEPVLVIDGAEPRHLKALLDYMYTGEMNVHHSQLASLLKTAEELRIKGLTDIRWNNKDEPPDCRTSAVTASSGERKHSEAKQTDTKQLEEARTHIKKDNENDENRQDKFNVNGGPPPLIKLPVKSEKSSSVKRDHSDTESSSPKRKRTTSGTYHIDDEIHNSIKSERDPEWQHGNLDISAERVVGWGAGSESGEAGEPPAGAAGSEDEWDAPTDIGCFLRTRLTVDGDNSGDEESDEDAPPSTSSSAGASGIDTKETQMIKTQSSKLTVGPKSGPNDPRFPGVVKLNDYLRHGRRPQFWEENYVKRIMEAVRIKELEMKQAAEILGVSYGTLYGRYRDVYGCINRPYRNARDFWQAKGPSELLDRLQRGEISLDAGAKVLGVSPSHLASYMADIAVPMDKVEFEPIPIEVDTSLIKAHYSNFSKTPKRATNNAEKTVMSKKIVIGSLTDEDPIPATVISTQDTTKPATTFATTTGKWPTIRVASLDTLRAEPAPSPAPTTPPSPSPSHLMRNRPDLTIVAAKKENKSENT